MRSLIDDMKHNYLFSAILTIVLGIVLVVWPDISGKLLCYALGAAFVLMGVIQLVIFMKGERIGILSKFSMFMGIILILLGIFVFLNPQIILSLIPIVLGIMMVLHGIMDIMYTLDIKNAGSSRWWVALIASVVTFILGVMLIIHPYFAFEMTMAIIGITLLYDGGSDLALMLIASIKQRNTDKRMREFAQSVTPTQEED